jgi:hypothetical protein
MLHRRSLYDVSPLSMCAMAARSPLCRLRRRSKRCVAANSQQSEPREQCHCIQSDCSQLGVQCLDACISCAQICVDVSIVSCCPLSSRFPQGTGLLVAVVLSALRRCGLYRNTVRVKCDVFEHLIFVAFICCCLRRKPRAQKAGVQGACS